MKKLAIITTHPIQYNAPLFKLISERQNISIKVFYTWEQSKEKVFDEKFGKEIKWDIPLLEGYEYTFVKNTAKKPNSAKFKGVINPTLNQEIENWQANAILVFGWNHDSHFKAMRYFKGKIPVYFRGDSTIIDEKPGIKTILRRTWLKFIYRYIDFALYVGTNNKQYFLKHGLKETQLIFAPHAIDNNRFFDNSGDYSKTAEIWRKELNYSIDDIVLLFVGKFEAKKNPILLINAAKQLPQFKFLFVGNGVLENQMKEESKDFENIKFLSFKNQSTMPIVYRLCNVLVLTSAYNETWGLAVNEAMACGKAILVSNKVGCAVDLVENGKNGYIFESNNLKDLVLKIKTFNIDNLKEFGEASKKIICNYNFERISLVVENSANSFPKISNIA